MTHIRYLTWWRFYFRRNLASAHIASAEKSRPCTPLPDIDTLNNKCHFGTEISFFALCRYLQENQIVFLPTFPSLGGLVVL